MKTKLEVGKEYWLSGQKISRGIYLGESNSGNFDFRITLGSKCTKPFGELDVMTSNLSVYSEYIPETPWQFTTPIAMKCTEEQFNGIKDRLVEMGYKLSAVTFCSENRYLSNFIGGANNVITDLVKHRACDRNRTVFESFSPDLFLALAAMTDKEDGIKGEWWRYTDDMNDPIVPQKRLGEFVVPNKAWRKATAQEIIEHFEKKEFVLPENFKVRRNRENYSEINGYAKTISNENFNNGEGFVYFYNGSASTIKSNCTEITFDQFKKYVLKDSEQSFQNAPVIGSVEYTVNVEFDAEKAAKEIFTKIVELGKSHQPEFKFAWEPCKEKIEKFENFLESFDPFINIKNIDKTVIPIPTTKQATLFDDRVEITDWKPKEGEIIWVVTNEIGSLIYKDVKYNGSLLHAFLFRNGFIKRTESEAKQLVEKLKQAML